MGTVDISLLNLFLLAWNLHTGSELGWKHLRVSILHVLPLDYSFLSVSRERLEGRRQVFLSKPACNTAFARQNWELEMRSAGGQPLPG